MSRESLTKAYRRGAISRREFVRGMVSLGLTISVASQLADVATAAPEPKVRVLDDVYGGGDDDQSSGGANGPDDGENPETPDDNVDDQNDDAELDATEDPNAAENEPLYDELGNIIAFPEVGVGQDQNRARMAMTLAGMGAAVTGAAAIAMRRKRAMEPAMVWPGWKSEPPADPEAPLALPSREE